MPARHWTPGRPGWSECRSDAGGRVQHQHSSSQGRRGALAARRGAVSGPKPHWLARAGSGRTLSGARLSGVQWAHRRAAVPVRERLATINGTRAPPSLRAPSAPKANRLAAAGRGRWVSWIRWPPSSPFADPLTAMGVVDSNMVVEHDSRRKPFGLWDGSRPSRRRLSQWQSGRMRSRVKPAQNDAVARVLGQSS